MKKKSFLIEYFWNCDGTSILHGGLEGCIVISSIQIQFEVFFKTLKNIMAPFYGWGSTASRLQPLRGGSLLFTIRFPEISGTHFIDLVRMKG